MGFYGKMVVWYMVGLLFDVQHQSVEITRISQTAYWVGESID
jgi:hypothetical protein